jgi:penicillin-binding protein 1A
MRRIALDPAYPGYLHSQFEPLPAHLQSRLACDSFREEPPPQNFFERLFDNVADKAVKTYEDWKNQRKQRRQEQREQRRRND